ncbi:SUKH-4 family immunity protein [Actinosynnema sp. NPDC020468]|uniref:SUKH-4 family immunity protein n=1 Tax=Actinosynnema sp. NPDC020468 TaxID=3154488 RepID=UPI0033ED4C35
MDEDLLPWPVFDLVRLPGGADLEVPRRILGGEYVALDAAYVLDRNPRAGLIAFGRDAGGGFFCVTADTGHVVYVVTDTAPETVPVNTDLARFRECARAVVELFPFGEDPAAEPDDRSDGAAEAHERAGAAVRAVTERIDPPLVEAGGFWFDLSYDIAMGDRAVRWYRPPAGPTG